MRQTPEVPDIPETVRRRVRRLRAERGLSAQQLVNAMREYGITTTRSTLSAFENGARADITFTEAVAMALVFDVPLASLVAPAGAGERVRMGKHVTDVVDIWQPLARSMSITVTLGSDPADPAAIEITKPVLDVIAERVARLTAQLQKEDT